MCILSLNPLRIILYFFLFIFSIALLVLTAYQINFTESLSNDFYIPIIVELLVTACLSVICSAIFFVAIACSFGRCPYWFELVFLGIIWIMDLVGAVIITRRWPGPDLTWCLGVLGVCRLIDAIVSYAWINWVLVNFLFSLSFFGSLGLGKLDLSGPAHKPGNPSRHSTSSREIEPQTVQMPEPEASGHSGA